MLPCDTARQNFRFSGFQVFTRTAVSEILPHVAGDGEWGVRSVWSGQNFAVSDPGRETEKLEI